MNSKDQSSPVKFSELDTPKKLADYLKSKGKGHTYYYHYTDSSVLTGMLRSRKLYLSRADTLNDFYEGNSCPKDRVYITSFSYRPPENIAMWSMYGVPYPNGIRLEFSRKSMNAVINQFEKDRIVYSAEGNNERIILDAVDPILTIIDVAYAHKDTLEHDRGHNKNAILFEKVTKCLENDSMLCWCIKHDIWLAEREVRLLLQLKKSIPYNKVAIDFSKALSSFAVTCGPCTNKKEIEDLIHENDSVTVKESAYQGKTYFKSCLGCLRQTEFCKKRNKILETNILLGSRVK